MKSVYPLIVVLFLGAFSAGAQANRNNSNGVPAELHSELQDIKEQLVALQQTVTALTNHLENTSAGVGDVSSKVCFEARLGLEANGTIGVQGVNNAGIGTGVDLYGLLDIDAGVGASGRAELMSMLASGVDVTTEICLNAGLVKVDGIPQSNERLQASPELLNVLDTARDSMAVAYVQMPGIVDTFDVGPEAVVEGIDALINAAVGDVEFSPATLLSPIGWEATVDGLPGGAILADRYTGVQDAFASMGSTDPCTYYAGIGPTIDTSLAAFINDTCSAVPAAISFDPVQATDIVYNDILLGISVIEDTTVATYSFLTGSVAPTLFSIDSKVNRIDDVVDDICSSLSC